MSLDNLRKLDAAASPGPWWNESGVIHAQQGDVHPLSYDSPNLDNNAQLAALSHLLLPAMEALEDVVPIAESGLTCWYSEFSSDASPEETDALDRAAAVLAQLDEALK